MSFQQLLAMRPIVRSNYAIWMHVEKMVQRSWQQSSAPFRWFRFCMNFMRYTTMSMFGLIFLSRRMRIIASAHCWFRIVDDILDGDQEPPPGFTTDSYRKRVDVLMGFLDDIGRCPIAPRREDLLLVDALASCQKFGVDITAEMQNLWSVMAWDYDRGKLGAVQSRWVLQYYAALQDRTIISVCVKMLGGTGESAQQLEELAFGTFTRVDWVADVANDLRLGIINIPQDVILRHNIDVSGLLRSTPLTKNQLMRIPGIRQWREEELLAIWEHWQALQRPLIRMFISAFRSRFQARMVHAPLVRAFDHSWRKATH